MSRKDLIHLPHLPELLRLLRKITTAIGFILKTPDRPKGNLVSLGTHSLYAVCRNSVVLARKPRILHCQQFKPDVTPGGTKEVVWARQKKKKNRNVFDSSL